jgi:predicted dinucleotide-utilizing enzyme
LRDFFNFFALLAMVRAPSGGVIGGLDIIYATARGDAMAEAKISTYRPARAHLTPH